MNCSNCGAKQTVLKQCTVCKMARYCDQKCQKADWGCHKKHCKTLSLCRQDLSDVDTFTFRYLNANENRNLKQHGKDTTCMLQFPAKHQTCLQFANLTSTPQLMTLKPEIFLGGFGKCFYNVEQVIKKYGGRAIDGWMLFENEEFLIEFEAHCVWQPPSTTEFVNVTASTANKPYTTLFVPDNNVTLALYRDPTSYVPNMIYWK